MEDLKWKKIVLKNKSSSLAVTSFEYREILVVSFDTLPSLLTSLINEARITMVVNYFSRPNLLKFQNFASADIILTTSN